MRYDMRTIPPNGSKAARGLVVHGDGGTTAVVRNALAATGFATLVECRGADTIPAIERSGGVDLVVVDSDTDGVEARDLIAYLRYRLAQTPILFVVPAVRHPVAQECGAKWLDSRHHEPRRAVPTVAPW